MGDEYIFRSPLPHDGKHLYKLAIESKSLDVNSEYAYILLGIHFRDSCVIVEHKNKVVGFVSGYLLPQLTTASHGKETSLFIWQMAVSPDYRRKGLARKLVLELLRRPSLQEISAIKASVTSLQSASAILFQKLAKEIGAEFTHEAFMPREIFCGDHEAERLITLHLNSENITKNGENNENGN